MTAGSALLRLYTSEDKQRQPIWSKIINALKLIPDEQCIPNEIINDLKTAIELNSLQAIYLLAHFIVQLRTNLSFIEQLHYLELAASFNHVDSAYYCGCIYASLLSLPTPTPVVNISKGISYLLKAIDLKDPDAAATLLRAIWDKEPPNIPIDEQRCRVICEDLIQQGEMRAALYYGMALSGFQPDNFQFRMTLVKDYDYALKNLLLAYKQGTADIKSQAYGILQKGYQDKVWPVSYSKELKAIVEPSLTKEGDRPLIEKQICPL